jgi:hypothetical protein
VFPYCMMDDQSRSDQRFRKTVDRYRRRETMAATDETPMSPHFSAERLGTIESEQRQHSDPDAKVEVSSPPLMDGPISSPISSASLPKDYPDDSPGSGPGMSERLLTQILQDALKLQSHALFLLGTESTHPPESLMELLLEITGHSYTVPQVLEGDVRDGSGDGLKGTTNEFNDMPQKHELLSDKENRKVRRWHTDPASNMPT